MAPRRGLRSVPAGPPAPPKRTTTRKPRVRRAKTVREAAEKGTTRELLVAMRDRIAEDIDSRSTLARDLASLSKRLMELQREIQAIDARAEQESDGGPVPDEAFDASAV
jgi:hypothetical protein